MKFGRILFWLFLGLLALAVLVWTCRGAAKCSPPPIPKASPTTVKAKRHRTELPTQGAGALALITKAVVVQPAPSQVFYFAATAVDVHGLESEYSVEISFTNNTALRAHTVTLAWDPPASTNVIANYKVFRGRAPRTYTTNFSAGTNLSLTIPLYPPPLTNIVLTVVCTNGGTNIAWSTSLKGPWLKLNTTNYTAINPSSPRYYRGLGPSGNRVLISTTRR